MPKPTDTPAPFAHRVSAIRQQLMDLVRDAAKHYGQLRMHVHFGDNYWTVTVLSDGTTQYENYAEENRGKRSVQIEELTTWELVNMVASLEA